MCGNKSRSTKLFSTTLIFRLSIRTLHGSRPDPRFWANALSSASRVMYNNWEHLAEITFEDGRFLVKDNISCVVDMTDNPVYGPQDVDVASMLHPKRSSPHPESSDRVSSCLVRLQVIISDTWIGTLKEEWAVRYPRQFQGGNTRRRNSDQVFCLK